MTLDLKRRSRLCLFITLRVPNIASNPLPAYTFTQFSNKLPSSWRGVTQGNEQGTSWILFFFGRDRLRKMRPFSWVGRRNVGVCLISGREGVVGEGKYERIIRILRRTLPILNANAVLLSQNWSPYRQIAKFGRSICRGLSCLPKGTTVDSIWWNQNGVKNVNNYKYLKKETRKREGKNEKTSIPVQPYHDVARYIYKCWLLIDPPEFQSGTWYDY